MKWLRSFRELLRHVSGEADYARYCGHLRLRDPGAKMPTAKEFYLERLKAKYSRPSRCC